MGEKALQTMTAFGRLLATAASAHDIVALLAATAVDEIGADGAAVLQLDAHGRPHVAAQRALDDAVDVDLTDADLGPEIGAALVAASGGRFAAAEHVPLVAGGDLFGLLVLLFREAHALDDDRLQLAGAVVDIAATALARARELEELSRTLDELKASREALVQAEKLRALGTMAAGVAHDVKNVFAPVIMQMDLCLRMDKLTADDLRARMEMMRKQLDRGLALVDRLRKFSRQTSATEPELAQLDDLVADAVGVCKPRAGQSDVDLTWEPGGAPIVRVQAAELVSGVANLIVNAIDAVAAKKGKVVVRSGRIDEEAFVEVTDDGPGIPPELRERIFEAFFTTKGAAGTGLGLAMVVELAQRHGGALDLDTEVGRGTTFRLRLPAARKP